MKSRRLGFAIFAALSFQATHTGALEQPHSITTTNTTAKPTIAAINKSANTANTIQHQQHDSSYFVGNVDSLTRARLQELAVGGPNLSLQESATGISEGRGRKKKKKKIKIKNPSMNMMVGGSMMAAFVVIFTFLNMITVTLGKALFFTFIAKFLVSVNWKSTESSSKKKASHDVTVVMT